MSVAKSVSEGMCEKLHCVLIYAFEFVNKRSVRIKRYLSLDALNGVHHHCHGPLRQRLEALLGVNVDTRQPAAKPGVTVVPAYHHLWPQTHTHTHAIYYK